MLSFGYGYRFCLAQSDQIKLMVTLTSDNIKRLSLSLYIGS